MSCSFGDCQVDVLLSHSEMRQIILGAFGCEAFKGIKFNGSSDVGPQTIICLLW